MGLASKLAAFAARLTSDSKVPAAALAAGAARANFGAGAVLQVVSSTINSTIVTASGSYVDTGLTATITPTSASSKILVLVLGGQSEWGGASTIEWFSILLRNGSQIGGQVGRKIYPASVGGMNDSIAYLDSPASTSALTYKTQFKLVQGSQVYYNYVGAVSITLIEIAG